MKFFSLVPWGILFACMYYIPKKRIQGLFPAVCFHLAYSWSLMPAEVVGTVKPNWCDKSRLFHHFPTSLSCISNLKLITPHLFSLSARFPQSSQPCDHRLFQIHQCNRASSWKMTLEHSLISIWHLPLFEALLILLKALARTFMVPPSWQDGKMAGRGLMEY